MRLDRALLALLKRPLLLPFCWWKTDWSLEPLPWHHHGVHHHRNLHGALSQPFATRDPKHRLPQTVVRLLIGVDYFGDLSGGPLHFLAERVV